MRKKYDIIDVYDKMIRDNNIKRISIIISNYYYYYNYYYIYYYYIYYYY